MLVREKLPSLLLGSKWGESDVTTQDEGALWFGSGRILANWVHGALFGDSSVLMRKI